MLSNDSYIKKHKVSVIKNKLFALSPKVMPSSKQRLAQSLCRKILHEPHIPIHSLKIMPQLWSPEPIPFIMLSEVPGFQHFILHKLTILLIRRDNKPRGWQTKYLLHNIHDSPGKLP